MSSVYVYVVYMFSYPPSLVGENLNSVQVFVLTLSPLPPVGIVSALLHPQAFQKIITVPPLRLPVITFVLIQISPANLLQAVLLLHLRRPLRGALDTRGLATRRRTAAGAAPRLAASSACPAVAFG